MADVAQVLFLPHDPISKNLRDLSVRRHYLVHLGLCELNLHIYDTRSNNGGGKRHRNEAVVMISYSFPVQIQI